ncbi:MAG: hypothetical protein IJU54_01280 [Alphaproteobacteria bacterium]|nr:hypothetical protein [Alphaproteobacteria bacterium]
MNNIITNGKYLFLILIILQTTASNSTGVLDNLQHNYHFHDKTLNKT